MSYARFGWDNSDVYIFTTLISKNPAHYAIECCGCLLDKGEKLEEPYTDMLGLTHEYSYKGFKAETSGEMIAHLIKHKAIKHHVPDFTIQDILKDYPDENKTITEYETEK